MARCRPARQKRRFAACAKGEIQRKNREEKIWPRLPPYPAPCLRAMRPAAAPCAAAGDQGAAKVTAGICANARCCCRHPA